MNDETLNLSLIMPIPDRAVGKKLVIFDLDGTLVNSWTCEIRPRVDEWFNNYGFEHSIAIATNQGGVGLRRWMESGGFGEPEKYPTEKSVELRIINILFAIVNQPALVHVSYAYQARSGTWAPMPEDAEEVNRTTGALGAFTRDWRHESRKPAPGMLLQAMADANTSPEETLMVGDSQDDRLAAEAAGCEFMHVDEFFGLEAKSEH